MDLQSEKEETKEFEEENLENSGEDYETEEIQDDEENKKPLLLITGIYTFLGAWVCKKALDEYPQYRIRGTVENNKSKRVLKNLRNAFGDEDMERLEIINCKMGKIEDLK